MSRTDPQFNLRIPQELRDRVLEAAQANKRSATAEILARLEASFAAEQAAEAPAESAGLRVDGEDGEVRVVTHQQLYAIVDEAIQSVLGGPKGPARPTKGPAPRGKFPKK